ncbi:MBL fold metallo-hydrolase [Mesorhizobium sp. CU2]|uniref:ComEC/Rec2 family competence protein n=1 Tax=unclassified Mesorhizobium TaxID=325217 RepID=UPI00112942C9|nr:MULTISPECIES: MBL fold metallo-hydrolase [unclassified Mesorhizobium]TPN82554.1 MBL fold metallo-hydrolase [Mesorhizobium sp. CU3]TPO01342.1 MBL fold metallo-hydrolase [Mesorhizobium sp. CU2]
MSDAQVSTSRTSITVFKVLDGDCIFIRCLGGKASFNVLIDGGRPSSAKILLTFIDSLPQQDRHIDLFVVTHIDADHISGAISIARDSKLKDLVRAVWFNGAQQIVGSLASLPLSVTQGDAFSTTIRDNNWPWNSITNGTAIYRRGDRSALKVSEDHDVTIRVLGPSVDALRALAAIWAEPREDNGDRSTNGAVAMGTDAALNIQALAGAQYHADRTIPNGSSIAFLLEHGAARVLVCADSHAETLVTAIDEEFGGELQVSAATLPHHGSKKNMSSDLAKRVSAHTWIISTEGGDKHRFPNGESIARVLMHRKPGAHARLVFNSCHKEALVWNDEQQKNWHDYSTRYCDDSEDWITIAIGEPEAPTGA